MDISYAWFGINQWKAHILVCGFMGVFKPH